MVLNRSYSFCYDILNYSMSLDDLSSLKDYIENRQNIPKNVYVETNYVETIYSSIPKLTGSIRN